MTIETQMLEYEVVIMTLPWEYWPHIPIFL